MDILDFVGVSNWLIVVVLFPGFTAGRGIQGGTNRQALASFGGHHGGRILARKVDLANGDWVGHDHDRGLGDRNVEIV